MMKSLWFGNAPWTPTGYGQQLANILPRFAWRYTSDDVAVATNYGLQGGLQRWNGIRIYPAGLAPYSDDVGPTHAFHFFDENPNAGYVFTLVDVWVLQNPGWQFLNVAAWCPVDHLPTPPGVQKFFTRTGATPIAMSRFGEQQLTDSGLEPLYVPLSVDGDIFWPVPEARKRVGFPEQAFIVGMVAANKGRSPSRKAFAEAFAAFGRFRSSHPDALLFVHAEKQGLMDGVDLERLVAMCGLDPESVMFADQYPLFTGLTQTQMAVMYSTFDVLLAPSYGEGFCVPVVEAQSCGVPVIVNDFAAQSELVGAGWKVGGQPWADEGQTAWFQVPSIDQIVNALTACYDRTSTQVAADSQRAQTFAAEYETGVVWERHWTPTLETLEKRLASN
jgi:glycosyltransferase involved in cell wall biosynthesis